MSEGTKTKPKRKEHTIFINGIKQGHVDLNNEELNHLKQLGYKQHEDLPHVLYLNK
jgi:hypothetical protein